MYILLLICSYYHTFLCFLESFYASLYTIYSVGVHGEKAGIFQDTQWMDSWEAGNLV